MKKLLGIIIFLLIIIIIIISVAFYTYVKNTKTEIAEPDNNIDIPDISDGSDLDNNPTFLGHTLLEIQDYIKLFFENYYGMNDVNAYCYYDQNNILKATVADQNEIKAEYSFDEETGEAINFKTGEVVNFFEPDRQGQRIQSNVEFTDNQCLAIGYVTDLNEVDFINKYFSNETYGQLPYYDFRDPIYQNRSDYGNKFVIVPINGDVNITVYDCYIGEDGELYTDNILIQSISEPFIILDDYIEYTPIMCIKFEYNGFEEMFPITFSGENGELVLTGCETEVKDISLY